MSFVETLMGSDERLPQWASEMGIDLPLAPAVVRRYSPTLPSEEDTWRQIRDPHGLNYCWLTAEHDIVGSLREDYRFAAVIDRDGEKSQIGFALPRDLTAREPFVFISQHMGRAGDLHPVVRYSTYTRRLGEHLGTAVYKIGHPYVAPDAPQEWYFLFIADDQNSGTVLPELIHKRFLVSGARNRGPWQRFTTWGMAPNVPFASVLR